jgi:AraC-like DNA-binding protein
MSAHRAPNPIATQPANCVAIWRPREFHALELHRGSEVTVEYPRHWHDEFYLSATLAGASYLDCAGTSFCGSAAQLVVVPSGQVHANRKLGCSSRTIFLDFKALQNSVERYLERSVPGIDFRPGLIDDSRTLEEFLRLHRCLEQPGFGLEQENSLCLFLSRLVSRHGTVQISLPGKSNDDVVIQRARLFLDEHYADRVSVHDLARLARLSPFHFHRSFCQEIGMPPHAYQLQLRIRHAKRLLRGGQSVSDTACMVGFFDQSHFVHCFKRSEGVTPSQYVRFSKNLQDGNAHTLYFEFGLAR